MRAFASRRKSRFFSGENQDFPAYANTLIMVVVWKRVCIAPLFSKLGVGIGNDFAQLPD